MVDESNGAGLTVKELVLRLDGKIDAYITAHEHRHDQLLPGSLLTDRHIDLSDDLKSLSGTVASHERTIQRMIGGMVLISALGLGTLLLVIGRIAGLVN